MNNISTCTSASRAARIALVASLVASAPLAAAVIDFADLSLAPDSFYNGGPVTNNAGWTSGGATFGNSYNSGFGGFWNGFSYSNINDTTTAGFGNQYAAYTGTGFGGSGIYAVAYSGSAAFINLPAGTIPVSIYLTNTTYAALSMLNGDMFAKKFGGASGDDPDYFEVIITGYDSPGGVGAVTGSVTFRLADYTFTNNAQDYIVDEWTLVDLAGLGSAASLNFSWASTDMSFGFINTPTYVALDNLSFTAVPEPASAAALVGGLCLGFVALRRRRFARN
jgi:hypothetical protein